MRRPALEVLFARAAQGQAFLLMLGGGLALGLLTLLSGALHRRSRWLGVAGDALCAAAALGLLVGGTLLAGDGLRLYALLGVLLGAALSRAGAHMIMDAAQEILRRRQERGVRMQNNSGTNQGAAGAQRLKGGRGTCGAR